jgi:hypothetical protein
VETRLCGALIIWFTAPRRNLINAALSPFAEFSEFTKAGSTALLSEAEKKEFAQAGSVADQFRD